MIDHILLIYILILKNIFRIINIIVIINPKITPIFNFYH